MFLVGQPFRVAYNKAKALPYVNLFIVHRKGRGERRENTKSPKGLYMIAQGNALSIMIKYL